jgi:hypothetical protein
MLKELSTIRFFALWLIAFLLSMSYLVHAIRWW